VIALWVVAVGSIFGSSLALGPQTTTDQEFNTRIESQVAKDLLERVRGMEPNLESVVVQSDRLTAADPAYQAFVGRLVTELNAMKDTVEFSVVDPRLVSADGRTILVPTKLHGDVTTSDQYVPAFIEVLKRYDGVDGFTVVTAGFGSLNNTFNTIAEEDLQAEQYALPVAFVVLLAVFGTVTAALLPLALGIVAIAIAMGVIFLISNLWPFSFFVTNMIVMMGLALGIDYSLFIVQRYREERRNGRDKLAAIERAGDTATRAVTFSGITVVIALCGLLILPMNIFRSLGAGAIAAAFASMLVGLTLLPALLSLLGDRINRLRIPFTGDASRDVDSDTGFWAGAARAVMAHPLPSLLLALALLLGLAYPALSVELGFAGAEALPKDTDAYRAFAILDKEFSAGRSTPTYVVVEAPDVTAPAVTDAIQRFTSAVAASASETHIQQIPAANVGGQPQFIEIGAGNSVAILAVALPGDFSGDPAKEALLRLRGDLVPAAFASSGAQVYVGGQTAGVHDFADLVNDYTPIVFAFVLGLSFVLLLLAFRSIVVPVKAILMNLLSVGAAYGSLVLVFQDGLGEPFGFAQVPTIATWIPLFLFAILFGLSMDYHVFLLSRIREHYDGNGNNTEAVAHGLRATANIITGAAAIMVVVFGGFALGRLTEFQQMGFGLAVAVFLDATVVRMVLVPAAMALLGDSNWYLPRWLRWLPDLRVEGGS
jgi:RND superfamily putative drug exporter